MHFLISGHRNGCSLHGADTEDGDGQRTSSLLLTVPLIYRDGGFGGRAITRGVANRLLREAMEVSGVNRVQRWLIDAGLRTGGWVVWRRYRLTQPCAAGSASPAR